MLNAICKKTEKKISWWTINFTFYPYWDEAVEARSLKKNNTKFII